MKFKRQILTILILSLPILAIAAGWLFLSKETPQPLFDPLTWKGLTPGASTKSDVLQIFGQPETPRNVGIEFEYSLFRQTLTHKNICAIIRI
ncbi:MAG TPA: hypothetical protein PKW33_18040 [Anaerolineaceae bacterium]|nr:hypothetical protein [Anaerolineaceae bacterium]HPN53502.1 hypothetical protein [Anaerolineaceae bacterium]